MAKLIFAMTQSLDGYVAGPGGALEPPLHTPSSALFEHFVEFERTLAGALYGRRVYELLRYWDEDRPDWTARQNEFARVWRAHRKWVFSRSSIPVGPNATLVNTSAEEYVRNLKPEIDGDVAVAGPDFAASLTRAGLIDEYHLCVRPVLLGAGVPYFADTQPELRLIGCDRLSDDVACLRYENVSHPVNQEMR